MRELKYELTTLANVKDCIELSEPLAFDLETNGFYGHIRCAQFYQEHWDKALLVPNPEVLELIMLVRTCHIVAHNTSYEVSTLQCQYGAMLEGPPKFYKQESWDDTLLLAKLKWYNKDSHTLNACYRYTFRADPYAAMGLNKKAMQSAWGGGDIPTDAMYQYAATDVFYLIELYNKCKSFKESESYKLDHIATSNAFKFQCNGFPFNKERILELREENLKRVDELAVPINVNSWQQVRPYIGENESHGLALATFALEGNDRARDVQEARKLLKLNSFLNKFLTESHNDRIYGKFTFTTKSGRGNCSKQNLQQLPRKTKGVFEAGPNSVFVLSDYAQLELRYACALTGEPEMEKLFKQGMDLHQGTADMMNVPRQQAKTCNFNLLYGGSAKMLRNIFVEEANLLLPYDEVAGLKKKWHNLWRVLTAWQDDVIDQWKHGEVFHTVLGRKFKAKLYTDAMNLPVSGGSAEISKLAMHKMCKAVNNEFTLTKPVRLCNFVHDSFIWECPDQPELYEKLASIVAESMKSAWEELVQYTEIPDLPMPVDVLVGKNWGDMEKGKEVLRYKLTI